jgi:hypothetical protein
VNLATLDRQIVSEDLAIFCRRTKCDNLATIDRQIVSKNLAISVCRTKSNNLAIKEAKLLAIKMMLRDADDVMLMSSSQRQGDTCHVWYSTYYKPNKSLLKTYLKPLIRLKHGFISCSKGSTKEWLPPPPQ